MTEVDLTTRHAIAGPRLMEECRGAGGPLSVVASRVISVPSGCHRYVRVNAVKEQDVKDTFTAGA